MSSLRRNIVVAFGLTAAAVGGCAANEVIHEREPQVTSADALPGGDSTEVMGPPAPPASSEAAEETTVPSSTLPEVPQLECVDYGELTLEEKVGRLIMPILPATDAEEVLELPENSFGSWALSGSLSEANEAAGRPAGDTRYYQDLFARAKQEIVDQTGMPAIFGLDEEGGSVQRSRGLDGAATLPSAREQGDNISIEEITELYRAHAEWLMQQLGVTLNFAPVADAGDGAQVGDRSYATNPEDVPRNAGAAIDGMEQAGMRVTLKHFPGLGNVEVDTHDVLGETESYPRLLRGQLPVFESLINSYRPDYVMMSHASVPSFSGGPASLSPRMYNLLRNRGFQGVAITDDLNMGGARPEGVDTQAEAALQAFIAGADVLLVSGGLSEAQAVRQQVMEFLSHPGNAEWGILVDRRVQRINTVNGVGAC